MRETLMSLNDVSDEALLTRVKQYLSSERSATARLLAYLGELDRRRLYVGLGYSSLFTYCTQDLHLSERAAYGRIEAARLARRFPIVLAMIESGDVSLTTLAMLGKHLTEVNHGAVLARSTHKSMREVELIVAELAPPSAGRPRTLVRRTPLPTPVVVAAQAFEESTDATREPTLFVDGSSANESSVVAAAVTDSGSEAARCAESYAGESCAAESSAAGSDAADSGAGECCTADSSAVQSLAADGSAGESRAARLSATDEASAAVSPADNVRLIASGPRHAPGLPPEVHFTMRVTISGRAHTDLMRARDLLRHAIPSGDISLVLERALALLIADLEKKRMGIVKRPRDGGRRKARLDTRQIPTSVRRQVWKRDGYRCAFIGTNGRCRERTFLEVHHVVPFAVGGKAKLENLELRCRAHNQHEADMYFGRRRAP